MITRSVLRLGPAVLAGGWLAASCPAEPAEPGWNDQDPVGVAADGRVVLPVTQTLTPAGESTPLPGVRPVAVALSPDGRWLVTAGKTGALRAARLDDPQAPAAELPLPGADARGNEPADHELEPDRGGQVSYTGLLFSPDGARLYLSNVNGSIKVWQVTGGEIKPLASWPLPGGAAPGRDAEIPAGLALTDDGARLYACGSLSNRLHELDTADGTVLRSMPTGMVPFGVVLRGGHAWVTNRAGRPPAPGEAVEPSGRGVMVRVEGEHALPAGSVTVLDLAPGTPVAEIPTGRQPGAIALSPDRRHVVVADSDSDTLTVIDAESRAVVETRSVRWRADDPCGASPTALQFLAPAEPPLLLVALGAQNALGVFEFAPGATTMRGLIPTGWYPSGIAWDAARRTIHVSNLKGSGSGSATIAEQKKATTGQLNGSLGRIPWPDQQALERHTRQVLANYGRDAVVRALLPPREGVAPAPVPERSGEPSVFRHVVYLIRENRTYDQVFGDIPAGNGDPELCTFGRRITPNAHRIARHFVLLDNTYCSGVLSADGHSWAVSAFANEYLERSFAGWPRSYPDGLVAGGVDVLAWSPAGFLWSAAAKAGRSVRIYGEMCHGTIGWLDPAAPGKPRFMDFFRDRRRPVKTTWFEVRPSHATVAPFMDRDYPAWAAEIPDQRRADIFIQHMLECQRGRGEWENLHVLSLPNDHTSGTKPGLPTPAASVADNDFALGRILDAVSHSSYWPETCVIAIEDDPQNGWDHVSAYRTVCLVASPYTKRGAVVSTHYNQPGVLRTIGLMLGLPPLNQLDAASTPLRDCFAAAPDPAPYRAVRPKVELTQLNPAPQQIAEPQARAAAESSLRLPLDRVDACDEDQLNRILWLAMKGPDAPYPEWAVRPAGARGEDHDDD